MEPPRAAHWEGPPLSAWDAWRPEEAARRLAGVSAPWCVIGGWALDLWLGRETRRHEDLEIAIPRAHFPDVRRALAGFDLYVIGDGETRLLAQGVAPPSDKHQNWVCDPATQAWRMDVMLEPGDDETWVYRRRPGLSAPRSFMTGVTPEGIPYLKPHGVLFYKAANGRAKDEADFTAAAPLLDDEARAWLQDALARFHPDSPWLGRL